MSELKNLEAVISSGAFFVFLNKVSVDDALDMRDSEPLDSKWMSNFERLEKVSISNEEKELVNSVREKAFKLSFQVIGESEISSCVSDDIELIAKDILLGNKDRWTITYLWSLYRKGIFPM